MAPVGQRGAGSARAAPRENQNRSPPAKKDACLDQVNRRHA